MGKRQVEQSAIEAAIDIDAFYDARIPEPATAQTLLVLSVDGKGIVIRPDSLRPETAEVVTAVFDQGEARDPEHRRAWVALVDGALHQIDLIEREAAARNVTVTLVVDFIHVLEYLRGAAWSVHEGSDPAAEPWVAAHARALRCNGDFDNYWGWHQKQDFARNHQARYRAGVSLAA